MFFLVALHYLVIRRLKLEMWCYIVLNHPLDLAVRASSIGITANVKREAKLQGNLVTTTMNVGEFSSPPDFLAANLLQQSLSVDIGTIHGVTLAGLPASPPHCFHCGNPSTRLTTRISNRNGNAGRPYFKCIPCNQFLVFADRRGNDPANPPCRCGLSSKRQIEGKRQRMSGRNIHFVCRLGTCDYYAAARDQTGNQIRVEGDLVDRLAALSII